MFGIGEGELGIIVVFGFLLFGPDKLPQMGRTIGRAIRQFRETQEKMTAVVQSEIIDPVSEAASAPVKPKKAAVDDDSDADEDAAETAAPAKKETFAAYKELYQKLDLYEEQKGRIYGYLLSAATDGAVSPLEGLLRPREPGE